VGTPALSTDDLVALRQLVDAYAEAVDGRDPGALVSLFSPDAELRVQPEGGVIEASWRGAGIVGTMDTLAPFFRTFHHVGGAVFEPDAGDAGAVETGAGSGSVASATGRIHCLAHHYDRGLSGPTDLVMMIRYHDRYHRGEQGQWRFADRQVIIDWTELHPAHPKRRTR